MADNYVRGTLAGILLFVIGIAIGGGAIVNYQRERAALDGFARADAEVVEIVTLSDGTTRPMLRFTAPNGDLIRFRPAGRLATREYHVGERVQVLYPIENPRDARLESSAIRWGRTIYAAAGGVLLMAMGAYLAFYARKRGLARPE